MFDNFIIDLQPGDRLKVIIEKKDKPFTLVDISTPKFEINDDGTTNDIETPDAYHWMVMIDMFFKSQLQEKLDHRRHTINDKACLRWNEIEKRYE